MKINSTKKLLCSFCLCFIGISFSSTSQAFEIPPTFEISCVEINSNKTAVKAILASSRSDGAISGIMKVDLALMTDSESGIYTANVAGHIREANSSESWSISLFEEKFNGRFPRLMQMLLWVGSKNKITSSTTVDQVYNKLVCKLAKP